MANYKLPDLPTDEELGIAGLADPSAEPPKRTLHLGSRRRRAQAGADDPAPAWGSGPWMAPATLLVLLALAWATSASRVLPRPVPVTAADTEFSSGRAMLDIVALSRSPRPPGTAAHDSARAYLMQRLVELGLMPQVQTATSVIRQSETLFSAATVRNLVARLPGTGSTGAVLLTAHYDSRELSRGAGDDATGVAVILETVRALGASPPFRNDLIVLLTDGEERGLFGARAFVESHPWMQDVQAVLSVDMRGGGGPSVMFETGPRNALIARALDRGTPRAYGFSMGTEVYRRMPRDTDFTPFREAGAQGLNFAAIGRANVYHQSFDEPARLDERTVQHHGVQLLGATRVLGEQDFNQVSVADASFFPVPLLGMVVYPPEGAYVVAAGLVVLLFGAILLLWRASGGAGGVVIGLLIAIAVLGINAAAAYFAFPWLASLHPEYGTLDGSAFHQEGWYAGALLALSLATGVGLLSLARLRFGLGSLVLGSALVPVLAALAATLFAPSAAANLQWTAVFAAAAAAVVSGVGRGARLGVGRWLLLVVLTAATFAIVVPMTELVWLSFGIGAALLTGVLVANVTVLTLPLLDAFRQPSGALTTVAALITAVVLGGVGVLQARPSREHPAPSTLIWALDHDSARALWATLPDGGEGWAANRTGVELSQERELTRWLMAEGVNYLTGPAPVMAIPPVEVRTVRDSVAEGGRRVTLALRSPTRAPFIAVRLPDGDVRVARINDVELRTTGADGERAREIHHYGWPEGELTLELSIGPTVTEPTLEVIEQHFRPELLLGAHWFVRPPTLVPNVAGRSDRALIRDNVSIAPAPPEVAGRSAALPVTRPPSEVLVGRRR
jgi:hypothetical protein